MSLNTVQIDRACLQRVSKARSQLVLSKMPFYGILLLNLEIVIWRGRLPGLGRINGGRNKTMAVNAKNLFVNPDWVATLSDAELRGVLAHEVSHLSLKHHTRRNGRQNTCWQISCDIAINRDLLEDGYTLPPCGRFSDEYPGMSAEQIYAARMAEQAQKAQSEDPDDQPDDEEDESGEDGPSVPVEPDDEGEDEDGAERDSDDAQDQDEGDGDEDDDEDKEGASDDASDSEERDEDTGDGADDNDDDGKDSEGKDAKDEGEPETDDQDTQEKGEDGPAPVNESDTGNAEDDGTDEGEDFDPGGCGAVLDADDMQADEAEWDAKVLNAAAVTTANCGRLPPTIQRMIESIQGTVATNWREILRQFVDQSIVKDISWNRPNRRHVANGLYLPGNVSDAPNHIIVAIDTSGSITEDQLKAFVHEMQDILDSGAADKITVRCCDETIFDPQEFEQGDEILPNLRLDQKTGGTNFAPVTAWAADAEDNPSCLIYFTDMICHSFGRDPYIPVLWARYGSYRNEPPFGTLIEVDPYDGAQRRAA